jgi:hypothetical protein
VRLDFEESEFEDLEQADGTGADDHGVRLDRGDGRVGRRLRGLFCEVHCGDGAEGFDRVPSGSAKPGL